MPSNVDVIVLFARSAYCLNGVFQPKKIRAAMITSSASSRIMPRVTEVRTEIN
jgi:hypothetical protein